MHSLPIPNLNLSRGQVLWAWNLGRPVKPNDLISSRLRHLVASGVPFGKVETGRGNRYMFNFDQFIEVGLALFAMQRGMPTLDVVQYLTVERKRLHAAYRRACAEQPTTALEGDWLPSRGKWIPTLSECRFLRMHTRFAEKPGLIEEVPGEEIMNEKGVAFGDLWERIGGDTFFLVPLTRVMLEGVYWAQFVPDKRTGPKT